MKPRKAVSYIVVEIRADRIRDAAEEAYRIAIHVGTAVHFKFGGRECTVNFRDVLVDKHNVDIRIASFVKQYMRAAKDGIAYVID